jgi:hypothetical protein
MPALKRLRQLQLDLSSFSPSTGPLCLSFQLKNRQVRGVLYGSYLNWSFESSSPVFLKYVPSGKLDKYALWVNTVPSVISELYNKIYDAALKKGCSLQDKEELH